MAKSATGERISRLRSHLRMTQSAFARSLGVTQTAVSHWESGDKEPGPRIYAEMGHMAARLPELSRTQDPWWFWEKAGVSQTEVAKAVIDLDRKLEYPASEVALRVAGSRETPTVAAQRKIPDAVAIPVLRDAAAAGPARQIDEREVERRMIIPLDMCPHPDDTICLKVTGDSMFPVLQEGYIVAIDTRFARPEDLFNDMVAARDPEGGVTIKWLRKIGQDAMLLPQNTSLRHQPVLISRTSGWKVLGKVLWWIGMPK